MREFAQRRVDVLDLKANQLASREFDQVAQSFAARLLELFAVARRDSPAYAWTGNQAQAFSGYLTFERLFTETEFVPAMRELCRHLAGGLSTIRWTSSSPPTSPPTGSFASTWSNAGRSRSRSAARAAGCACRRRSSRRHLLFESHGPIVGHSLATAVDRLIYVVPSVYSQMSISQRYSVARTIGRLTHLEEITGADGPRMLIGPGRWGTSMPSLGVPVSFAEINTVSVSANWP